MAEVAEHAGSASVLLMQQGPTGKEASRMQCCEPAFSRVNEVSATQLSKPV